MTEHLEVSQIKTLRDSGAISENEVAFRSGDLIVAENVITRQRRVVENGNKILSETKQLLRG